jgi:hypothetical protein
MVVGVLLALTGCSPATVPTEVTASTERVLTTTATFAPGIRDAEDYLLDAIEIVERNALFADAIDWDARRVEAHKTATGSTQPKELHAFVRSMLVDLGDNHSFFGPPTDEAAYIPPADPQPSFEVDVDRIGHITLTANGARVLVKDQEPNDTARVHAMAVQRGIEELDGFGVCGWIVDLRQNTGGNMWPMIAGIGPLLGSPSGDLGYFLFRDNLRVPWSYDNGAALLGESVVTSVADPITVEYPLAPVAVLTSAVTASAGEMVLISFAGRPNTRVFGFDTEGVPTPNSHYTLSDGAHLIVTIGRTEDRLGHIYDPTTGIAPDEMGGGTQPAQQWLLTQPACQ